MKFCRMRLIKFLLLFFLFAGHLFADTETSYEIIQIQHLEASGIAQILIPQFPNLRITIAQNKNALVVSGPKNELQRFKTIIPLLDIAPQSVKITAQLLEISGTAMKELGIEWPEVTAIAAFQNFTGTNIITKAAIHTLQQKKEISVTETATITVLTGNTGSIKFQSLIPVKTMRVRTHTGYVVENTALFPVGLELIVRPQILANNSVKLAIMPQTGRLKENSTTEHPAAEIREASSILIVRSGETVALGSVNKTALETASSTGRSQRTKENIHMVILVTLEILENK